MATPDASSTAAAEAEIDARHVEELLRSFGTALRSFRLYGGESPMLGRFVEALRQKLTEIFEEHPLLRLEVEEDRILWEGRAVYPAGAEGSELAFLFYKDGIRELTLLDGFQEEVPSFLAILGRVPHVKDDEDDLVTLLWSADLAGLRYDYVEPGQEGLDLGSVPPAEPEPVQPETVRSAAREPDTSLSTEDFEETLYFLDDAELRTLAGELEKERARDLDAGVLTALYDRLEDGTPERQVRIVRLLGEFLPSLLAGARFGRSAEILRELVELASRGGLIAPLALREIRQLFSILSAPDTIEQLVDTLEEQPDVLQGEALGALLGFFPPESLAPLMRATSRPMRPDVRRALEQAVDRLAEANREEVVKLLSDADSGAVVGALQWVGRLGVGAATSEVTRLLGHAQPEVRAGAAEALQELRAAAAARSLVPLLQDPERDVRVAACRALAALEYAPAREALETAITGKDLRAADRTEKVAFFEAFGRLAGGDGIALLDRTLNGRSWLGRGESTELRACAALALGRVRHPAARTALESAAGDSDPVVRTAVARALRGETQV
jgi:HEAT repeat protein